MKKQNYGHGLASGYMVHPTQLFRADQEAAAAKNKGRRHWETDVKPKIWSEFTNALDDYVAKRGNGDAQDNPKNAAGGIIDFPVGGDFNDWKNPKDGYWYIRYTEGLNDKAWMEERDRNYILRLEREGRLLDFEPNADKEIVADHKFRQEIVQAMQRACLANSSGAAAGGVAETKSPSSAKEKEIEQQQAARKAQKAAEEVKRQEAERKAKEQAEKARLAEIARRQAAEEQQRRAEAEQQRIAEQQRLLQFQQYCLESGLAKLAKENNLDGIHYLLSLQDIDINTQDAAARTALHYVAAIGELQLTQLLVQKGANVLLQDGLDQTARDLAKDNKHIEVAAFLRQAEQADQQREQQSPQPIPIRQPRTPQQPIGPALWGAGGGNPAGGDPAEPSPVDIDPALYIDPNELTLIKKLKVGGFGIVYQGMWGNKAVAIKQLKEQEAGPADAENERDRRRAREEFVKELCMMKNLRHPCIVTLYGISYKDNRDSMVMEFLPKGALTDLLKDPKKEPQTLPPFPWSQRLKIAIEIGQGLAYLHRRHVVHHDLHPGNVLLDEQGQAKLADFGLSKTKQISDPITSVGQPRGHNRWRAPETFKDQNPYTKASDIFSYGLILWSIATRQEPHERLDTFAAAQKTIQGEFEPFPEDCPRDYQIIAAACRQMEPRVRPTANVVVERLGSIQLGYVGFFAPGGVAAAGGGAPAEHAASPTTPAAH